MYQEITDRSHAYYPDTGLAVMFRSAGHLWSGVGDLLDLNFQTVKISLSEQLALFDAALFSKSIDEVLDLQSRIVPSTVKKQHAYFRHLNEIAVHTQNQILGVIREFAETASASAPAMSFSLVGSDAVPPVVVSGEVASTVASQPTRVTIVDSSGNAVSSSDSGDALH